MQSIRNIALIAHVDHGKTTLVDRIIQCCHTLDRRKASGDLILDNNDLERERGITILSKNIAVHYKETKINLIDTPGHADFGGEVERVLKMTDGVLLLVDAFEGPMPQTRFLLNKAIELGLQPIVVINKVDKQNCTPDQVQEAVFDLMFNLGASEAQLDFTTLFGSAKQGWMSRDWRQPTEDISPLLDAVLETLPEAPYQEGSPQMQVASSDFSSFAGRIAIGRVYRGALEEGRNYALLKRDGEVRKLRIRELHLFEGLGKKRVSRVPSGELCAVVGLEGFEIGDTLADPDQPEALPRIKVDEPTMSMLFTINNSPFFGQEGKYVTSRRLRERLFKETEKNLALRVEETDAEDAFNVYGRGVLHLSILIETMRREGYELQVGKPRVLFKQIDGVRHEPMEQLVIDLPEAVSGKAIELVTQRKGVLQQMEPKGDLQHLVFEISSRGLIGLRNLILTATAGQAVMYHRFEAYAPHLGALPNPKKGALVSAEQGQALAYAINRLQDRGTFFVAPGDAIYKGQVVGAHTRDNDLEVNLIKGKKLTNMRASGSDEGVKIAPKIVFSLEEALEYVGDDEYVELTPQSIRLRKIGR